MFLPLPPHHILNLHKPPPSLSNPSALSLILFPNEAERTGANPEPGVDLLLDVGLELVNQPHLLLGLALHQQELDDAGGLVHVDAHPGRLRERDIHVLAVVPHLEAGARPAGAPGATVLPEAAGPLVAFSGGAFTDQPDHHPAVVVHLPVTTVTQQILLTQHLQEERAGSEDWSKKTKTVSNFSHKFLCYYFRPMR